MSAAPLTAAVDSPAGERRLITHLEGIFRQRYPLQPGDRLLVAVSGGLDSTALLWAMTRLAARHGVEIHAAHLDHGLDSASRARAAAVARLCRRLAVPLHSARMGPLGDGASEGTEAGARRERYRFLERRRRALDARWVLTAHHADDQAETVLLRCLYGSGIAGLAGISERRAHILRPLLSLRRSQLAAALDASGLQAVEDPTNRDLRVPRNLVRHRLIPALEQEWPSLRRDLVALARAAGGARGRLGALAGSRTGLRREPRGVSLDRAALLRLPEVLWPFALARACRLAGLVYPPSREVRRELRRQLTAGGGVGCDQGGGWRWRARGQRLFLGPAQRPPEPRPFRYSFTPPGEVEIPELGLRLSLHPAELEPWMLRGAADRTGLSLRLRPGEPVTVRSRRPGDRVRPLGSAYRRRLKKVLGEQRMPRHERDRLPLLEVGDRIVWVPGVTVDHECRLAPGSQVWQAEIKSS